MSETFNLGRIALDHYNHFIPFTEVEVGAPERFESDFMVQYLAQLGHPSPQPSPSGRGRSEAEGEGSNASTLSREAIAVMCAGRTLWQAYFSQTDEHGVRESLKLNRADVGWYQIRKALEARNANGYSQPVSFNAFKTAYDALGDKLRPQVYTLGFMRV